MTMRLLHCCFILIALTCTQVGFAKPLLTDSAQCDTVELLADALDCNAETCNLIGNATVTCQDLVLQADSIVIQMTPDYGFNGARASGNVIFLDGDTLIRCNEVNLKAGRIQGKIKKAHVQVFANHVTAAQVAANPESPRLGRALQTVRGDIQRVSKDRFTLKSGTFTLCDCGGEQNPSWRLGASEVDVKLKDRATLWWPKLELNFLGIGMLPLPLPTPVLSLPIQKRAAGLLAPSIIFLRDAYPILDFPLFIPMGNSYDLTVSPGLRTDWGLHRGKDVSTWSAPRLGARVRYAPVPGLQGSVQFQWTRDTHFTAARLARLNESHSGLEDPALIDLARQDPRWGLRDRVVVQAGQTWLISPATRWNLKAHWVSDDYIQRDFSFHLADQVSQYLPSRTRLDWHTSHILVSAQADYLQRLNNGNSEAGYSNTSSNEGSAMQRAPNMELWLRPQHLGQRFFVGGGLVIQRYGNWASTQTPQAANQWDFYQRLDFSYLNQVGPFQLKVKVGSHLVGMLSESDQSDQALSDSVNLLPFAELRLRSTLAKKFSQITHIVQPFVAVQFVYDPAINDAFSIRNPWRQLGTVEQVAIGLRQSLTGLVDGKKGRLDIELSQPMSLRAENEVLPTALKIHLSGLGIVDFNLETRLDWQLLKDGPTDLRATTTVRPWNFIKVFSQYGRLSPGSEVLGRSIYELSGATDTSSTGQWMHYLRAGTELYGAKTWKILYQTDVLLPLPGVDSSERPQISNHLIRMGYRSPCECWGVDVVTQMVNPDLSAGYGTSFLDNMTVRVNLTIGDYTVGSL